MNHKRASIRVSTLTFGNCIDHKRASRKSRRGTHECARHNLRQHRSDIPLRNVTHRYAGHNFCRLDVHHRHKVRTRACHIYRLAVGREREPVRVLSHWYARHQLKIGHGVSEHVAVPFTGGPKSFSVRCYAYPMRWGTLDSFSILRQAGHIRKYDAIEFLARGKIHHGESMHLGNLHEHPFGGAICILFEGYWTHAAFKSEGPHRLFGLTINDCQNLARNRAGYYIPPVRRHKSIVHGPLHRDALYSLE